MADNINAIAYIRVSTEEQATEGFSLAAQEERLRAYCVVNNLQLRAVLREEGVSGKIELRKRPEGGRLAQLLRKHKAAHVLAVKLDRVFRNTIDAVQTVEAWDKAGIALHVVDMGGQPINTKSAVGRLFLTMLAGFAEFEREMISERTRAAMTQKKLQGEYLGSTPYGFLHDGKHLVVELDELSVVREIFRMRAREATLQEIADDLNTRAVPTKRGRRWHPSTVNYILNNLSLYRPSLTKQQAPLPE